MKRCLSHCDICSFPFFCDRLHCWIGTRLPCRRCQEHGASPALKESQPKKTDGILCADDWFLAFIVFNCTKTDDILPWIPRRSDDYLCWIVLRPSDWPQLSSIVIKCHRSPSRDCSKLHSCRNIEMGHLAPPGKARWHWFLWFGGAACNKFECARLELSMVSECFIVWSSLTLEGLANTASRLHCQCHPCAASYAIKRRKKGWRALVNPKLKGFAKKIR